MNIENFNNLKESVNKYKKIYNEYLSVLNLWKDVTKYLKQLRDEYRVCPTYELKKEIDKYSLQERDYFNLFNEYQQELAKIGFDKDFEEKREFVELSELFDKLNKEINLIEKKSKKFGSKKEIGTNRVETRNAEGRKKCIHDYLLNDYNLLVKRKREILPRYKELYKKYIDYDVVFEEPVIDIEEEVVTSDSLEGIKLEEKYFNMMTIDEKIDYYYKRINNIINAKNTGKKVRIKVYGVSYYVPKKYEYLVRDYLKEIKKLNDSKKELIQDNVSVSSDKDENYDEIISFINEKDKKENNDIKKIEKLDSDDKDENYDEISAFISERNQTNNNGFIIKNVNNVYSLDNIKNVPISFNEDRDIWSDSSLVPGNNVSKFVDADVIESKALARIEDVKKPKKKFSLKKKLAAIAAAVVIAITSAFTAFGLSIIGNKKDDSENTNNDNNKGSYSFDGMTTSFPVDDLLDKAISARRDEINSVKLTDDNQNGQIDDKKDNNETVKTDANSKLDNNDTIENVNNYNYGCKIGDNVNIREGAAIYDNVYDAMNQTNGMNPYFDGNIDRKITGSFVNCDSYSVYTTCQDEVDQLVSDGGVIESVIVGKYEGAYNIKDLKPKVKVKTGEMR